MNYEKYDVIQREKELKRIASEVLDFLRDEDLTLYEFHLLEKTIEDQLSSSLHING